MIGKCKQCGRCCMIFGAPTPVWPKIGGVKLVQCTQEENDYMSNTPSNYRNDDGTFRTKANNGHEEFAWRCAALNPDTHKCSIHEGIRPEMCTEFPWYGRGPVKGIPLFQGCGFEEERQAYFDEHGELPNFYPKAKATEETTLTVVKACDLSR